MAATTGPTRPTTRVLVLWSLWACCPPPAVALAPREQARRSVEEIDQDALRPSNEVSLNRDEVKSAEASDLSAADASATRVAANSSSEGQLPGLLIHKDQPGLPGRRIHNDQPGLPPFGSRSKEPGRTADMVEIFTLCVCMYGIIAVLWILFWQLSEDNVVKSSGRVLLLCITWASMSVGMQVLNKTLVTKLQAPALISVAQMWIAVVLVGVPSWRTIVEVPRKQLMVWMIVPIFFAAMLCTSFYTYQYISLSLYTVIRNMTPLIVLPIERTVMPADKRPRLSIMVVASMAVMLVGALLYGGGVGNISLIGCIFALANMFLAVADRLIQRRLLTTECSGLASAVCTVANNFCGSIPSLLLAGATHQISGAFQPEHRESWTDPKVVTLLVLSGAIGIGICYLGFECQRAISATSFFVLQNFSKVAVVVCGIAFFEDPIHSPLAIAGLVLSIGGSFSYGRGQMLLQEQAAQEMKAKQKQAQQAQQAFSSRGAAGLPA